MSRTKVLIYLLRRDLRVTDNPILHHLASSDHGFTHLLPIYVFAAQQFEVSGFLKEGSKSPYPEARSQVGRYWRCGPYRAKFLTETVWDLKDSLEAVGSGLVLRVGMLGDVTQHIIEQLQSKQQTVGAVWMTSEEGDEEKRDEQAVQAVCQKSNTEFKMWKDEKYFVDDRDLKVSSEDLPNIFTTWQKSIEPLRSVPRAPVPKPTKGSLPPFVEVTHIPLQQQPFTMPDSYAELEKAAINPVKEFLSPPPDKQANDAVATSAHPFKGGETAAQERLRKLFELEVIPNYHSTRNGLLGTDYSTKLSAYLALGSLTARQIHHALLQYEDGLDSTLQETEGYGKGENDGSRSLRYELVWRDYMRLCTRKFGSKLFALWGFKGPDNYEEGETRPNWRANNTEPETKSGKDESSNEVGELLDRFFRGTTGMGLIDASQRELLYTGYTSNRARQNVASFLAKHLSIDWRYGAEWYEMLLIDYDVSSNWANWQYTSGVGNDPRGTARIFNPVKQGFEYDKEGAYVRAWVPELKELEKLENVFQPWTMSAEDREQFGLADNKMATDPVKKINFDPTTKPPKKRGVRGHRGNSHHHGHRRNQSTSAETSTDYPPTAPRGPARGGGGQWANYNNSGQQQRGDGNPAFRGGGGGGGEYRGRGGLRGRGRGTYRGYHQRGGPQGLVQNQGPGPNRPRQFPANSPQQTSTSGSQQSTGTPPAAS